MFFPSKTLCIAIMPGHEKRGKKQGDDPDPTEYLCVSMDMKREDQSKVYDSKKSFWIPDGKGGFIESILESDDGKVAKVIVKGYEVCNLNVSKYDLLCHDHLNLS